MVWQPFIYCYVHNWLKSSNRQIGVWRSALHRAPCPPRLRGCPQGRGSLPQYADCQCSKYRNFLPIRDKKYVFALGGLCRKRCRKLPPASRPPSNEGGKGRSANQTAKHQLIVLLSKADKSKTQLIPSKIVAILNVLWYYIISSYPFS